MDEITISTKKVDEERLRSLLSAMGRVTDAVIEVSTTFTIRSDSPSVLRSLGLLLGCDGEPVAAKKPRQPRAILPPVGGGFLPNPGGPVIDAVVTNHQPPTTNHQPPKHKAKKEKPFKLNPAPRGEIKSWHVWLAGQEVEVITISEKNRRLNVGEFETGTILSHPKAGRNRILGEKGMPQGMEPA